MNFDRLKFNITKFFWKGLSVIFIIVLVVGICLGVYGCTLALNQFKDGLDKIAEKVEPEVKFSPLEQSIRNYIELDIMYQELERENEILQKVLDDSNMVLDYFTVTTYTQNDEGCNNITSIGLDLNKDWVKYINVVAVDPKKIPYGKTIFMLIDDIIIQALAVDTGFKIKGNKIDWYNEKSGVWKNVPVWFYE